MKTKNRKKANRFIKKVYEQTNDIIDNVAPLCRKCLYCTWIIDKGGEFEVYADGCMLGKKGIDKLFCTESIKQRAERPIESLHNYAMSYVEGDKLNERNMGNTN